MLRSMPILWFLPAIIACGPAMADDTTWNAEPSLWKISIISAVPPVISALALSPDGKKLGVGFATGQIFELDANSGNVLHRAGEVPDEDHDKPDRNTDVPEQDSEVLHPKSGGSVQITALCYQWNDNLVSSDNQGAISTPYGAFHGDQRWVTSLTASPKGVLASGGYDRVVKVWGTKNGLPSPTEFRHHKAAVKAVHFSPDGTRLVSGSADRTAILWDVKTREPLHTLKGHGGSVRDVKFSPDGKQIATVSEDGGVRLWNAATGERQKTLTGHAGMVWRIAYSPDGKRLASGGFDQTVRLWNPTTGERKTVLRGPEKPIVGLAFGPDSATLYVASQDRSIRRYSAEVTP